MATALMVLLANLGMEVAGPAATVAQAERLAARHRPDLAVVDINLKGEMAYDLVSRLHDWGVPVIVVSGYAVLPRLSGKTVAILQKPLDGPDFVAALRQAVGVRGAPSSRA